MGEPVYARVAEVSDEIFDRAMSFGQIDDASEFCRHSTRPSWSGGFPRGPLADAALTDQTLNFGRRFLE